MNRRSFIKASLAAGAFPFIPACCSTRRKPFVGDKVKLACIGIGQQAWNDMKIFAAGGNCEFVAFCDTDMGGKQTLEALRLYPNVPRFRDFRVMFDKMANEIDAVAVMTPDFSHFPASMMAMKLGIPVFVEKPLAHTFEECELLMAAEKEYGVVTQMGNQGHSGGNYYQFEEYVKSGIIKLDEISKIVTHMNNPRRWHKWNGNVSAFPKGEKIPSTLDWDTWLGTASFHEYSKDYVQGEWRSWYDFGCGCLGDWGAHTMDTTHRFFKLGLPEEVTISNVKGWNPYVFPMQDTLVFKFPAIKERGAINLEWYEGVTNMPPIPKGYKYSAWDKSIPTAKGSTAAAAPKLLPGKEIYMKDGTVWQGNSHSATISKVGSKEKAPEFPKPTSNHYDNFLLSVMGKETTKSPFSVSAPLSEVFMLGCIAQRLNRSFKFDPVKKEVIGDEEAQALLKGSKGTPRKGWECFYKI
jgi:predicted dehydrogenase